MGTITKEQAISVISLAREKFSSPLKPNGRKPGRPRHDLYHSLFNAAVVTVMNKHYRVPGEIPLEEVANLAGLKKHRIVIYHVSLHEQNMTIHAYNEFYTFMEGEILEILSGGQLIKEAGALNGPVLPR